MAIKDFTNNWPASKNSKSNMPELSNDTDTVRASHVNKLVDAQIANEDILGDDTLPAGSLRKRVADLEATSGTDEKVKTTATDNTQGFLNDKLVPADGIEKTVINPGATETLQIKPTYGTAENTVCEGNDSRLSDSRAPTGAASGDLSGTYPSPSVTKLTIDNAGTPETLDLGDVADTQFLKRDGSNIVGSAVAGGGPGSDTTAIHDNEAGEISAITSATPVSGDQFIFEDASDSNNKKRCDFDDLGGGGGASSLDEAYDGGGSGNGRTVTADAGAVQVNADGNAALKTTSANGIGADNAHVEHTYTQEATNKPTHRINHDFNSYPGSGEVFIGINSGDGTPNGETIRYKDITIPKKVPTTTYRYLTDEDTVYKKESAGAWTDILPPGGSNLRVRSIHGTSDENIWIAGNIASGNGYLAHYDGTTWTQNTTHPAHSVGTIIYSVYVEDEDTIWTFQYNPGSYIYKSEDGGVTWIEKDSTVSWDTFTTSGEFEKVGDVIALVGGLANGTKCIRYSNNNGTSWSNDTSIGGSDDRIKIYGNAVEGVFYAAKCNFNTDMVVYRGFPGNWGVPINTYTGPNILRFQAGNRQIWASSDGKVFAICSVDGGANCQMVHGLESGGTPVAEIATGASTTGRGLFGFSSLDVFFWAGGKVWYWDGASLTSEDRAAGSNYVDTWGFMSPTGTGTFGGQRIAFTGDVGDNEAVANEVGAGATHALKAVSGRVELNDTDKGVVTLVNQSADPATVASKGHFYVKGGEAYYKDASGNVVQLTSGGEVIGGGAAANEETWNSPGTDDEGDLIVFGGGALNATPRTSSEMLCGYDIQVYCNGIRMHYSTELSATDGFTYSAGSNEITLYASGGVDRYDVYYGS